jgi:hypothetical protein
MRSIFSALRSVALAACGLAVAAPAWAQGVIDVPKPFAIPLPPIAEPHFEVGLRYWQSTGKTHFSINSSKTNPTLGNPTSRLKYDDMDGYAGEFFWYARNDTDTFAKGFVGGGGLSGGSLDDEDYYAGQVKFSDTFSKLKGSDLIYGTIDVGQHFKLIDRAAKVTASPFIGFNFWQETADAYGVRCNPDDVPPAESNCAPPGRLAVPYSTKVIQNEANWASLRLGGELKLKLWDRLTLTGEAAILPVAYVWNEDSHLLRADLGPVPNAEDRGTGWGYQLEASARYDLTEYWSAGAGVRYWYAKVDGDSDFVHLDVEVPLKEFVSERFGVFGDVSYRF